MALKQQKSYRGKPRFHQRLFAVHRGIERPLNLPKVFDFQPFQISKAVADAQGKRLVETDLEGETTYWTFFKLFHFPHREKTRGTEVPKGNIQEHFDIKNWGNKGERRLVRRGFFTISIGTKIRPDMVFPKGERRKTEQKYSLNGEKNRKDISANRQPSHENRYRKQTVNWKSRSL